MTDELELLITGRQFGKMCEREYEVIREKYGLRKVELNILYFLDCSKEMRTAGDIAQIRQVSKAHISSAVENLVKKELLKTQEDPKDRRRTLLELTGQGKVVVEEVGLARRRMSQIVYRGITEEEKAVMQQAAKKMLQNMQEEIERSPETPSGHTCMALKHANVEERRM